MIENDGSGVNDDGKKGEGGGLLLRDSNGEAAGEGKVVANEDGVSCGIGSGDCAIDGKDVGASLLSEGDTTVDCERFGGSKE